MHPLPPSRPLRVSLLSLVQPALALRITQQHRPRLPPNPRHRSLPLERWCGTKRATWNLSSGTRPWSPGTTPTLCA